jgi:hypothetical protein
VPQQQFGGFQRSLLLEFLRCARSALVA